MFLNELSEEVWRSEVSGRWNATELRIGSLFVLTFKYLIVSGKLSY